MCFHNMLTPLAATSTLPNRNNPVIYISIGFTSPVTSVLLSPAIFSLLRGLAPSVEAIGDCTGVGYLEGAIHEGFRAASEL